MRQLYISTLRTKINYACPAWYIPGRLGMKSGLVKRLEKLQDRCLRIVSRAWRSTDVVVLRKELNLESIQVHLERLASSYRARTIGSPHMQELSKLWTQPFPCFRNPKHGGLHLHPLPALYEQALSLRDAAKQRMTESDITAEAQANKTPKRFQQPASTQRASANTSAAPGQETSSSTTFQAESLRLSRFINKQSRHMASESMSKQWTEHLEKRRAKYPNSSIQPAHTEDWGKQSLEFYKGLFQ